MRRTLTVQEDPQSGDLFIELPEELMSEMNWFVGDNLQWKENKDGSWSLSKSNAPTMDKA